MNRHRLLKIAPAHVARMQVVTEAERRRANKERIVRILDMFMRDEPVEPRRAQTSMGL